jgi:aspartate racemase
MTTIGLIGGMSWESSAEYYRLLNELTRARRGGLHSAECVLWSVDFAGIERMQAEGRWDDAAALLAGVARKVQAAGADVVLLCTNTMHKVADAVEAALDVPLLHLVDATAEEVTRRGVTTVGLLGTRFTMEDGFYAERMARHGITTLVPGAEDRDLVHRVIYDELCLGVVREDSRAAYVEIVSRLADAGAEAVVAGCTEIELLVRQEHVAVPLLPSTRLHVEAALAFAGDLSDAPAT